MWSSGAQGLHPGSKWALTAVVWACFLLVGAMVFPLYSESSVTFGSGHTTSSVGTATLFAVNGFGVFIILGVPLLLSLACYAALRLPNELDARGIKVVILTCVVLVWIETVLGAMSIGLLLLPTAILLTLGYSKRSHRAVG